MDGRIKDMKGCKKALVTNGVKTKRENIAKEPRVFKHGCYDALVMKKFAAALGGRVKIMFSGAASLDANICSFF